MDRGLKTEGEREKRERERERERETARSGVYKEWTMA